MAFRKFGAAAVTALTLAFAASPASAVTEIQWWHAMTGPNNDVVVKLATDFNASQSKFKVIPRAKGDNSAPLIPAIPAVTALTLAFAASPASAVTEIQWWHAMT